MKKPNYKIALLDLIIKNGGEIKLPSVLYPRSWKFKTIIAVPFTEEYDDDNEYYWNEYVRKVRDAIGVECYCEWVRDDDHDMKGVMAFYDSEGCELKTKWFTKWSDLFEKVSKIIS